MPSIHSIAMVPPGPDAPRVVNVIVEIPKGRRSKFEVDKRTGLIRLDRYLYSSLHYPGDYGYIPQTLAEDGDPLDILVMVNEPTFSGCLIEARPIGLFKMTDKGANDYKVLAVPNSDPIFRDFQDLWRVPAHFLKEVEHFFATYKELENPDGEDFVKTLGWESSDKALHEINTCIKRHQDEKSGKGKGKGKRRPKAKSVAKATPPVKAKAPRPPKRRTGDK
jgi:inorganic pyrophosphatase